MHRPMLRIAAACGRRCSKPAERSPDGAKRNPGSQKPVIPQFESRVECERGIKTRKPANIVPAW
jgi:hypothetical protein